MLVYTHMGIFLLSAAIFIYIGWVDCKTMEIPDRCHVALLLLGGIEIFFGGENVLPNHLMGLVVMALPMFLMALLYPGSIGGGDIKMCGATGFLLGASQVITGTLAAFSLAGLYAGVGLLTKRKKRNDVFPLGPFLSLGYVGVMIEHMVNLQ